MFQIKILWIIGWKHYFTNLRLHDRLQTSHHLAKWVSKAALRNLELLLRNLKYMHLSVVSSVQQNVTWFLFFKAKLSNNTNPNIRNNPANEVRCEWVAERILFCLKAWKWLNLLVYKGKGGINGTAYWDWLLLYWGRVLCLRESAEADSWGFGEKARNRNIYCNMWLGTLKVFAWVQS